MIIKKPCKFCHKVTNIKSELKLGDSKMFILECGHSYTESSLATKVTNETGETKSIIEQLESSEYCNEHGRQCNKTITSGKGFHLFPYQAKGIAKALKNNGNFIFADEMGLGKTCLLYTSDAADD